MIRIRDNEEKIILDCQEGTLAFNDAAEVDKAARSCPENSVIVNLDKVSSIKNDSLDLLKEISKQNELSLCNLDADIFAVMNLLHYDKYFKIYPNEQCSIRETHELKNRRFKIV